MQVTCDPDGPLYGLDIETDTSLDGLDPNRARVVAVAISSAEGDQVLLGDESDILTGLDRHLRQLVPGTVVTWNGSGFDLPFLATRAALVAAPLGLRLWSNESPRLLDGAAVWPPPLQGYRASWGAHGHLDGFRLFRADVRRTTGLSCGLKPLARLLGLEPVEVEIDSLHTLSPEAVSEYVASDARLARALVMRRMPAAGRWVDRRTARGARSPVAALRTPSAP